MAKSEQDRVSLGLLSLVTGGLALPLLSVPYVWYAAIPLGVLGLVMAGLEFMSPEKERDDVLAGAGAVVCVLMFILMVWWPFGTTIAADARLNTAAGAASQEISFPAGKQLRPIAVAEEEEDEKKAADAGKEPKGTKDGEAAKAAEPIEWIDATAAAAQQGEIAVSIASVAVRQLELTTGGETNETKLSPEQSLIIRPQVVLTGTRGKYDFKPWGEASYGDASHKPTLADNTGKEYPVRVFEADAQVAGQERKPSLYPRLFADDLLVFEAPPEDVEYLHLSLPASAFGGAGTLRFQIPAAMIEREKPSEPSPEQPPVVAP